jgi:hypothetical protein
MCVKAMHVADERRRAWLEQATSSGRMLTDDEAADVAAMRVHRQLSPAVLPLHIRYLDGSLDRIHRCEVDDTSRLKQQPLPPRPGVADIFACSASEVLGDDVRVFDDEDDDEFGSPGSRQAYPMRYGADLRYRYELEEAMGVAKTAGSQAPDKPAPSSPPPPPPPPPPPASPQLLPGVAEIFASSAEEVWTGKARAATAAGQGSGTTGGPRPEPEPELQRASV